MIDATNIAANIDPVTHPIQGHARAAIEKGEDGFFSMSLISHVEGNLWTGGCIGGVRLPDDFRNVISLYPWEQYVIGPGTVRHEVRMYDSLDQAFDQVDEIAQMVIAALKLGKLLVHCQAGLNRSGLITARALILMGRSADEAISLLREKRSPAVLCNQHFEDWLRS